MKIDLHSHSTVSDGLDSPAALVGRMADAGLTAFALTDHDTLQGLPEAREEAGRRGIELISGAEISSEWGGQDDIHILALFVDENNEEFNSHLALRQEGRRTRGERMARQFVEHGFALDLDAIRADVGDGVWGRPHLARALIRAGHASSNDDAFDRFLGREHPWYVAYEKWQAVEVIRAIRDAGGVSSLAHSVWYKDTDALVRALAAVGLGRDRGVPSRSRARRGAPLLRARPGALARRDGGQRLPRDARGSQAARRRLRGLPHARRAAGTAAVDVAFARTGSAACGGTGLRLACGLDRRPDPSLAAAPAARGSSPVGDSPRRVHAHLCRSPTLLLAGLESLTISEALLAT